MSSLFDAPVQLMLVLATVVAGQDPAPAPPIDTAVTESAATGPFSFSESAWLKAVRDGYGGQALAPHRSRIFTTSGGRVYIPVQSESREILRMRQNAATAQAVAVDLAKFHAVQLRERLGHAPGVKDLYAAHMFGLDAAARLAGLAATKPKTLVSIALPDVAALFPEAAQWRGTPVTIASLYDRLPDGQDFAARMAVSQLENNSPAVQENSRSESPEKNAASLDVHRAAPLRGIIKDADGAGAMMSEAVLGARMAGLTWATQVSRAP